MLVLETWSHDAPWTPQETWCKQACITISHPPSDGICPDIIVSLVCVCVCFLCQVLMVTPIVSCYGNVAAALTTLLIGNLAEIKSGPLARLGTAVREACACLWTDFDKRIRRIPLGPSRETCWTFCYFEAFC